MKNSKRYLLMKRISDVATSVIALILLSPFFLIISVLIRITSKGPVFFSHRRIGLHGNDFNLYKFRTMLPNAEQLKANFSDEQKMEFELDYKLKNDPRVTAFGGVLRITSLDELPQLFNVLKGEMSMVGPRPIVRDELAKYGEYADLLLSVKPGLTGLWQISGRNDTSYEERVQLDAEYIKQCSLLLDLKIFLKTFREVFYRMGAY